jgi:hypothetical protein
VLEVAMAVEEEASLVIRKQEAELQQRRQRF